MEGIKVEYVDYSNHESKCRICFKAFANLEHHEEISKPIEKKFYEVTQTNLKLSNEYSNKVCVVCNFQLKDFCTFKRNVIQIQKGLYKFMSKKTIKHDEHLEDGSSVNVDIKSEVQDIYEEYNEERFVEPEIKIIDETEYLDYNSDLNSDQLQYEFEPYCENQENTQSTQHEIFQCKECSLTFVNENVHRRHHMTVHLKRKQYTCDSCSYRSFSKKSLRDHFLSHTINVDEPKESAHAVGNKIDSGAQFECTECLSRFPSNSSLYNHRIKMHICIKDPTKWACQFCNTSFSGSRTLRDHILITHSLSKPQLTCAVKNCTKVFLTPKRLRAHMKVHDNDAKEMCQECGLLLTSRHNLEKHVKRVHLRQRNFFCDICGYSATFKHSIATHMESHVDPNERRKWNCDLCDFISVSKQSLRAHRSYEHSGKVYTCHCGKSFNQRASLSTHIKCVHHKIKDHLCNICGKAYFTRKDLQNHKKSQHMMKDMPCGICGKLFATQKHLTRHLLYHNEPKYKCCFEGCSKAFIDNAKLKDHIKLHEGNRDHICHLCTKSYFHQKDLKRHLDVAHKATIFYCEICTFQNSRKDYLRNHLNSAHKHLSLEEKNEIMARTKVTRNAV